MIRLSHLLSDLKARIESLKTDHEKVVTSRRHIEKALKENSVHYGINTGFGVLANKRISKDQLEKLQHNLLVSHAVGVGDLIPKDISKIMLGIKIHSLSLGYSGVSEGVFERLLLFYENDWIPAVPSKGSLGASGDLAPLSHMCLPLIGLGHFWEKDKTVKSKDVLTKHQLKPIKLKAKDGLALNNGTQMMAAYGAHVLYRSINLLKSADIIAATSLDALHGSIGPFDARIHQVRKHLGQAQVAQNMHRLLENSEILSSHSDCEQVQDQYSLRCIPQVHGASRDALAYGSKVIETEINSVTDNPLVFDNGDIVSGGNFHGQPLALAMDFAAIALAEMASISERRIYLLLSGRDGLPELLMEDTGVNSGFMIPQYTAASLVSHNKVLCHPASTDSIPTCLGQEDHVSMGSISAIKLLDVLENVEKVLAIEWLTAAQALDYRAPLKSGLGVDVAYKLLRRDVKHKEKDGDFQRGLSISLALIGEQKMLRAVEKVVGVLN